MIGFDTIGNATLIGYDDVPVLVTDPWIKGSAYFGSWRLTNIIPAEQMDAIGRTRYVWFSHAHPDHLNGESLETLRDKEILLPDHVGSRVYQDLSNLGFQARILPERQWVELSEHIRIFCVTDFYQNAALLIDINGTLLINLNDCIERGWGRTLQRIARTYKTVYLLKLCGFGDADMMNFFSEDGRRIPPQAAANMERRQIGKILGLYADLYHATHVVPFSSFHQLQREDSVWARQYETPKAAYKLGFDSKRAQIFDPFVRVNCDTGELRNLCPPPTGDFVLPPEAFGDSWAEPLEKDEQVRLAKYIREKEMLFDYFGFIRFRVGRRDTTIDLNPKHRNRGITFEVPRNSLMTAVQYEVFDDLLIGNFMKTTLHGCESLYPHFNPVVPKYADNGHAQTREEVERYLATYRSRAPIEYMASAFEQDAHRIFRKFVREDSTLFKVASKAYCFVRR
jgi:hypothetical protein